MNKIDAGKAELSVNITSPSGRRVPYDNVPTGVGERFTYVAQETGIHNIFITYGGLEVPGRKFFNIVGLVTVSKTFSTDLLRS